MKLPIIALSIAGTFANSICAQSNLYFDGNGATPGESNQTSFDWGASVWTTDTAGAIPNIAWTAGSTAILGLPNGGLPTRTLNLTSNQTVAGIQTVSGKPWEITGTGKILSSGLSITAGDDLTINSDIQSTGTLSASIGDGRTLTLSGTNTATGGTLDGFSTSTVKVTTAGALGTGEMTISRQLKLDVNNQTNLNAVVNIRDNARLINADGYTGTLRFSTTVNATAYSSANAIAATDGLVNFSTSGNVSIEGGQLIGSVSVGNVAMTSGQLNTGYSQGFDTITVNGDLAIGDGMVTFNILNPDFYGHLDVTGNASLHGMLRVFLLGHVEGYDVQAGDSFDLFTAGSVTGTFDSIYADDLGEGLQWDTSQLYTTGTLSVTAVPEPATYGLALGAVALAGVAFRRRKARSL